MNIEPNLNPPDVEDVTPEYLAELEEEYRIYCLENESALRDALGIDCTDETAMAFSMLYGGRRHNGGPSLTFQEVIISEWVTGSIREASRNYAKGVAERGERRIV